MRMRFPQLHSVLLLLSAIVATAPVASQAQAPTVRARYNFNPGWLVFAGDPANAQSPEFDDSAWKHVTLPYAWNEDSAFKVSIHDMPTGIAWYRKHFSVPANSKGQRIFLEFEGIRIAGEVYLNGKSLGLHEDGITAFGFDITDAVFLLRPSTSSPSAPTTTGNIKSSRPAPPSTGTTPTSTPTTVASTRTCGCMSWRPSIRRCRSTRCWARPERTSGPRGSTFPQCRHGHGREPGAQRWRHRTKSVLCGPHRGRANPQAVATMAGPEADVAPAETHTFVAAAPLKDLHFWSWGYGYLYDVVTTLSVGGQASIQ